MSAAQTIDDEELLVFTQNTRVQMVDALCAGGKMPVDSDSQRILLQTLKDLDGQNLAKRKIVTAAKQADAGLLAIDIINQVLNKVPRDVLQSTPGEIPSPPVLTAPEITLIPGELECGESDRTFADFQASRT